MSCISCGGMNPQGLRDLRRTLLNTMHSICPSDSLSINATGSLTGDGNSWFRLSGKKETRSAYKRPSIASANFKAIQTRLT